MRLVPLLLLAACAEVVDDGPDDVVLGTCEGGDTQVALVSSLAFARAVDGVSEGFDLDGAATARGDATGCGVADLVGVDGTPGVDNAFAALVPVLEQTEAGALEPLVQYAINSGGMMVLLRWSGLDDPYDDTCVTVETLQGVGEVYVGTQDRLLPGQTVDVHPDGERSSVPDGRIEDGRVLAGPLEVTIQIAILDVELALTLRDVQMRLEPDGNGGYTGVLGGGVDVTDVIGIASLPGIADVVADLVGPLLGTLADLAPDENGACTRVSFGARFEAVPVYLFEEPELTP